MSDGKIVIDTEIDDSGASEGIKKLGSKISGVASSAFKGITVATAAATAGITALVKESVDGFASYEQLVGGVETLFKNSANVVEEYAGKAYMSAGMSANQYMDTITSFSASLIQSLKGDTAKAAEVGNQAVIDMSDNVNKMGSNMEDVQNAYRGFSKQNYTMLDNLKLGYGGTKQEMERLLQDAEKLTGKHYDVSNFADITEAIHAIQTQMGITGTTAKEASSTIEGSLNSMKAKWKDVVTSIARDDADLESEISSFIGTVETFGKNIIPRIEQILKGIGELINRIIPSIMEELPNILSDILPDLVDCGVNMIDSMIKGFSNSSSQLIDCVMKCSNILLNGFLDISANLVGSGSMFIYDLAEGIVDALPNLFETLRNGLDDSTTVISECLPYLIEGGIDLVEGLGQGIAESIPTVLDDVGEILDTILFCIEEYTPRFIEGGLKLILTLGEGILNAVPRLLNIIPEIVNSILNVILNSLPLIMDSMDSFIDILINSILEIVPKLSEIIPTIFQSIVLFINEHLMDIVNKGADIVLKLAEGILISVPVIIAAIPVILSSLIDTITSNLPSILEKGVEIVLKLVEGLLKALPQLILAIPQLIKSICLCIGEHLPEILWMGCQIIWELIKGIAQIIPTLLSEFPRICISILEAFKSFDFIQIGVWILQGIGQGILDTIGWLIDKAVEACEGVYESIKDFFGIHSPSHLMRDNIGNNLVLGIGVGFDKEIPDLKDDIEGNLDDIVNSMQAVVGGEIAYTTSNVVAYSNSELNRKDVAAGDNINNQNKEVHKHYHVGPQEFFEVLAPYADEIMEDWRNGR